MLKLILATSVALYAAFVIWGKPDATPSVAPAPEVAAIGGASDADFDAPVILSQAGAGATVTQAAVTELIVPDAARIAAGTPPTAPGREDARRIGDPVVVSLVRPAAEAAQGADAAPDDAPVAAEPENEGLLRVSGTSVNMRSGPSTSAEIVDSLAEGALAEPLGPEADGWIEIRGVASGLTGFMSAQFLDPA